MKHSLTPVLWLSLLLAGQAPATGAPVRQALNDSGQTTCVDPFTAAPANCAGTGQDGETGRDVQFPDDRDGAAGFRFQKIDHTGAPLRSGAGQWACVLDRTTGLMWELKTIDGGLHDKERSFQNANGLQPNDAAGFALEVNAQGLCGHADWRLPQQQELLGLVDYGRAAAQAAIDEAWFPHTRRQANGQVYWSATPDSANSRRALSVNFADGSTYHHERAGSWAVRLVRRAVAVPAQAEPMPLQAQGAEVTDLRTGLIWRRCPEGAAWSGIGCDGTALRYTWSQALVIAQEAAQADALPWRLPNVKELASIIDQRRDRPAVSPRLFPGTPSAPFWTSTHATRSPTEAWFVDFLDGDQIHFHDTRRFEHAVRLVRTAP